MQKQEPDNLLQQAQKESSEPDLKIDDPNQNIKMICKDHKEPAVFYS